MAFDCKQMELLKRTFFFKASHPLGARPKLAPIWIAKNHARGIMTTLLLDTNVLIHIEKVVISGNKASAIKDRGLHNLISLLHRIPPGSIYLSPGFAFDEMPPALAGQCRQYYEFFCAKHLPHFYDSPEPIQPTYEGKSHGYGFFDLEQRAQAVLAIPCCSLIYLQLVDRMSRLKPIEKLKHYIISLSDLIIEYSGKRPPQNGEYARIRFLMNEGNNLCESFKQGDFVARLGLVDIRRRRKAKSGDEKRPAPRTAYILKSFKRKEEVDLFRTIYGKAFNLISVYSSTSERLAALSHRLAASSKKTVKAVEHEALELINIDAEEDGIVLGQKVRDTFPLADYFVTVKDSTRLKAQLARFVQLIFGNPYVTPTRDEHAMFFAQATALRSADLSRQVGAVIVSSAGEILATGCNEVPKAGGGLYWADDPLPKRDMELGHDMNAKIKREIVEELIYKFRKAKWMRTEFAQKADNKLYEEAVIEKKGFCERVSS